jgi:uncharacterized membrane protein
MSYGQPPPPPPPGGPQYGGPPPGYGAQPQKNSAMAITGLVLGIIGVIPCFWGCLVFSIGGVVFGLLGKKDVRESNGAKKGDNLAQWGFILGLVGIALGILYWILVATGVIDITYDSSFGNS